MLDAGLSAKQSIGGISLAETDAQIDCGGLKPCR
jgi:hypothetical protein